MDISCDVFDGREGSFCKDNGMATCHPSKCPRSKGGKWSMDLVGGFGNGVVFHERFFFFFMKWVGFLPLFLSSSSSSSSTSLLPLLFMEPAAWAWSLESSLWSFLAPLHIGGTTFCLYVYSLFISMYAYDTSTLLSGNIFYWNRVLLQILCCNMLLQTTFLQFEVVYSSWVGHVSANIHKESALCLLYP